MKTNYLKNILLSATIIGSISLSSGKAFADPVTTYSELKTAINNATAPTSIDIQGKLTDDTPNKDAHLKLHNKSITINGVDYVDATTGQTLQSSIVSNGKNHLGFDVQSSSELTLNNLTISNFKNDGWGGTIYNEGKLAINNVSLVNNVCSHPYGDVGGGAISNHVNGYAKITGNSSFIGNSTTNTTGGAIFNSAQMEISTDASEKMTFQRNSASKEGGAIYNDGVLSLYGNYEFLDNSANTGGAIYNDGTMSIQGSYKFSGNTATSNGGAITNEKGNLSIIGTRSTSSNTPITSASDASISFEGNSVSNGSDKMGGAIYVTGTDDKQAFLTINNADFKYNSAGTHGGAIYLDKSVDFNIENSKFIGNRVLGNSNPNHGWGGAIGLGSQGGAVNGYINNTLFDSNYSSNSGGAIPSGTALTIVNSVFTNNQAKFSAGAVSYDPRGSVDGKFLKIIADGGDTVFSGNWVGDTKKISTAEGLYIGNAIVGDDGESITGNDGNDSNVYFNAGNSGRIIFNDIVNAKGDSPDNIREKNAHIRADKNNPNIQLNKGDVSYSKYDPNVSTGNINYAPSNGTIIFNNTVQGANLVLHNGTLAFGQNDAYAAQPMTERPEHYFSDDAKITLKGGTLDLINNSIEEGDIFNPVSISVINNANLRLDVALSGNSDKELKGTIDYIDSVISGGGTLNIDKISFSEDENAKNADVGKSTILRFAKTNSANTVLSDNLKTIITSNAGYTLNGKISGDDSETTDSIEVTKTINAGGLPVAVSLGSNDRTYIYNATADEEITGYTPDSSKPNDNAWGKKFSVWDGTTTHDYTASNILQGEKLTINGNGKNIIASKDAHVIGIEVGSVSANQVLTINDVKKADNTGWGYFNSAIINKGGTVSINNSIFSDNQASEITFTRDVGATSETKLGNGGALYNEKGTLNITNTDFLNNSATANGGAIYNAVSGIVNINATDENTVTFNGNTATNGNDIYNDGTLNLTALEKSSIVFNGGISGGLATDGNNLGIINIGNDVSRGDIIFNNTVANQNINLNYGTLQLGANATEAKDNYFNNVNLTLNGGTLNAQNGQLDTIKVKDLTIGDLNPELKLDVNLNGTSDKIEVSDNITSKGKLWIGSLNIKGAFADGKDYSIIHFINKDIQSDIAAENKYITINGVSYSVSVNSGTITIMKEGDSSGFAYWVINPNVDARTFTIGSADEIVNAWLEGGNNRLAGTILRIEGGTDGKSLIGKGIKGVELGEYNGNTQQLTIDGVTSYEGFDSAIINNDGKLTILSTKFTENHAKQSGIDDGNGGVIQNNSGTVTINDGTVFSKNQADGKGGAIYNSQSGIVNMATTAGKTITFEENTADSGNDIYNEGVINISGAGKVLIGGGIAGTKTSSITNTASNIELGGSNSDYLGTYTQNKSGDVTPTLTVKQGATFFGGTSNINAGTLNWNTENDIADDAKLTINNAALVVGENGLLTIKGESSIDNASSVTSNGNLVLAKNMTVKTIDGSGKLTANNSTLTFDNNSSLGNNLTFASNNATANIENITNADSIINKIASGENNKLTINIDGSNTNADIGIDSNKISDLNFSGNVNYGGKITGTSGNVTNSGDLKITDDQKSFTGTFTQNSGSTTVANSNMLFGGEKNINGGTLTISSGTIDYARVNLGSGATLNQTLTDTTSESRADLKSNAINFTGEGASANFSGGNINLSRIDNDNGSTNTISFDGSNVKLVGSDYTGSTIYDFKNSEIDVIKGDKEELGNYVFDNIKTDNTKLSFNIRIKRDDNNGNTISTDTITVNGNQDQVFKLGNIHISGEENGQRGDYNSTNNTLNGAAVFDKANTITGATTSWIYDITNDDQSVKLSINDYANSNTLNNMNTTSGKRFFQFTEKTDGDTYHIAGSLDEMKEGKFIVSGGDERRDKYTLTGDGTKSFFNITGSEETSLNIKNLTISSAYKDGNGSVISNTNEKAVINIENTIITGNTSTGNGGAIYNGVNKDDNNTNLIISDTVFDGNSADGKGGAIYNAGNMTLMGTEFRTDSDKIYLADNSVTGLFGTNIINSNISSDTAVDPDDAAYIANFGTLYLNGDNSGYTGDFSQREENAVSAKTYVTGTFFSGHTDIDNGELNWMTDKSESGILNITGGKLNIISSDTVKAKLTLAGIDSENEDDKEYSVIGEAAQVFIDQNSELELKDLSQTTLDSNDVWGGKITLNGCELNLNDITNYREARLEANTGDLNIKTGNLILANNSYINDTVKTTIADGANLQINDTAQVSLKNNSSWVGNVTLNGGNLTVDDLTSNGTIKGESGTFTINKGVFTVGNESYIKDAVETIVSSGSTLDITGGGYVHLGTDDTLGGQVILNGGTLDYSMVTREGEENVVIANTGKLNLLENSVLSIKDPSVIKKEVDVDIRKGATVNLKSSPNAENGSKLELDANDKWNGLITSWTNATLETDGVDNSKSGGQLQQNRGNSIFTNKSNILIDGKNSYIVGGNTSILSGSALHLGSGVEHFVLDNLNMAGNSLLNSMNNTVNKYGTIDNMNVDGVNNVSIDVAPRDWKGDTFVINNLKGQNNGTLNISDFNFIGLAPVDRHIKIQVFDAQNINDVNFTASDKKIFTPIGNYQMFSQGGGAYTASLVDYNPQVYRGQVATLAAYNHQLLVDDMLTNHFILPNERLIDKAAQANKTSSVSPLFAPYQSTIDDGGIWTKTYVSFETLSMTNNLKVGNNVYGTLIGADFPSVKLKKGWKFIPTAYIGYNGGMQGFNNVDMYQNGGQGGFMGTFIKNNFIGSITAYGGGYFNEMSVAGNTDHTGNWFAGTAAKAAYNIHATKHFIIQPTAFVSYNIFGKQNWGTDYGSMSMNSGTLNGINVAPGMNLIYSRDTWSVYGTIQYMFNINDQVGGKAGNVNLPKTEMRHGYINYGIGATKTWKDRLTSYFQINFRNGGRTGIGFQLGLNYLFDWGKAKKKTSQITPTTSEKHVLKSAK